MDIFSFALGIIIIAVSSGFIVGYILGYRDGKRSK